MLTTDHLDPDTLRDPDRPPPQADALESSDHFVFCLRGRTYAISPRSVELVVPMQPIVAVPTVGAHVRGIIHLRGRVIAVVDLAALLGIDDQPQLDDSARLVIVDAPAPFAFIVDATLGIWAFNNNAQTRTTDDGPIVSGRIEDRGGAATLIDPLAVVERVMSLRAERP